VLPSLEELSLGEPAAGPDGVQRLAERLGAGALPAVTLVFWISAACTWATQAPRRSPPPWRGPRRPALPRLKALRLSNAAIGDAGLVALAPALRRLPALEYLSLWCNPRSAMRALPPSSRRRRRRQVRCRRLGYTAAVRGLEC